MSTMPEQKPGRSKQDYSTPRDFLDAVRRRLGIANFTFDFAADQENAITTHWWGERDDSLSKPTELWKFVTRDGWGWLNPPFAKIEPWTIKCMEAGQLGARIALLVPAGVGANWYRDYVDGHAHVLALNGRLCFINDWPHTIDPSRLKRAQAAAKDAGYPDTIIDPTTVYYLAEPLYPKDCILALYGLGVHGGFEVWDWHQPVPVV
jgi:phage N-6-adenine-methyltransferase